MQRAYGYVYDPLNRLLQGDFVARTSTTTPSVGAWTQELDNYRLSFVSYDDNGNILTLRRRGLLQNASRWQGKQYGLIDNLTYSYQGNRLLAVDDQVMGNQLVRPSSYHGAPTSLAGDFQEQGVHLGQEYFYDASGNMTQDKNKGITGITYNSLDQPKQIHFGTGADSIAFRYTGTGTKVAKLVYQTGKPMQRTDYLGPYQYEGDSLRFFPHAGGRVLRFVSKDPTGQPHISYQREYTFSDHLGNLRLAYRAGQVRTYTATLEQDPATHQREAQQFDSLSVSTPIATTTPLARTGQYAARLNAGTSTPQPLGPLMQLAVQKGDTITVTAQGLYQQAAQAHGFWFSLTSFLASLIGQQPSPPPGELGRSRRDLPLLQIGVAAGLPALTQLSGGVPKSYLRVLIFNQDSALVSQQTQQLTQAAYNNYEQLRVRVVLPQGGYVTAYVGSESDVDVFFDDITVEHRAGLRVQEHHYDPYGLNLAGLSHSSPGLRPLNKYQFNGVELSDDLGLGLNLTLFRLYDPQLGRFHQVDPLADFYPALSPFSFAGGNPVNNSDPEGLAPEPGPLLKLWRGLKTAVHGALGYHRNGPWRNPGNPASHTNWVRNGQPAPRNDQGQPIPRLQPLVAQVDAPQEDESDIPDVHTVSITPFSYPKPEHRALPPPRFDNQDVTAKETTFKADIRFRGNSVNLLDATAVKRVRQLAQFLKDYPQIKVVITSNAATEFFDSRESYSGTNATRSQVLNQPTVMDGVQSTTGNLLLGRARSIQNTLIRMGVDSRNITTKVGGNFWGLSNRKATIKFINPNGR